MTTVRLQYNTPQTHQCTVPRFPMNHVPVQIYNLQAAIAALEAQRTILGDAVIEAALQPLQ